MDSVHPGTIEYSTEGGLCNAVYGFGARSSAPSGGETAATATVIREKSKWGLQSKLKGLMELSNRLRRRVGRCSDKLTGEEANDKRMLASSQSPSSYAR